MNQKRIIHAVKPVENILAENLAALMKRTPALRSATRLHAQTGVGLATIWRIRNRQGAAQIDVVDRIARAFGLRAANLLNDSTNSESSPSLRAEQHIAGYEKLSPEAIEIAAAWQNLPESDKIELKAYLSIKTAMTFGVGKAADRQKKPK